MTNKEIFALSKLLAKDLRTQGLVPTIAKAQQPIYNTLHKQLRSIEKEDQEKKNGLNLPDNPTDTQLREALKALLVVKLKDNTLTAAEIAQLKDVFGLADATSDLTIEVVNYADSCPECARRDEQNEQKPL